MILKYLGGSSKSSREIGLIGMFTYAHQNTNTTREELEMKRLLDI